MRAAPLNNRAAVLTYLVEHGRTSTDDLYKAVGSAMRRASFNAAMMHMRAMGYVHNLAGPGMPGIWVADATALPEALQHGADGVAPEPAEPIHDCPRYCPAVAPPRQHDTRQCTGWRPPAMACARPGATDFLSLPSRVGDQRRPHQTGYIAALASGHNPPADA